MAAHALRSDQKLENSVTPLPSQQDNPFTLNPLHSHVTAGHHHLDPLHSNRIRGTKERENAFNIEMVKRLTKMNVIVQKIWDKQAS